MFLKTIVEIIIIISELGYDRYKFVVQCVIGEQRGEGVKYVKFLDLTQQKIHPIKSHCFECIVCNGSLFMDNYLFRMGCRCFWDSDTDNYAQDIFMNVR